MSGPQLGHVEALGSSGRSYPMVAEGVQPLLVDSGYVHNTTPRGHFSGAHDFIIKDTTMNDYNNYFITGQPVLDRLMDAGAPDAGLNANARYPPPKCHPDSRRRILEKLEQWLLDPHWGMFWLYGPAGVGKSAIAQTFAEHAKTLERLGAAYFFFAPDDKRSDPLCLIPSLAYQLAVLDAPYKEALAPLFAADPSILRKTLHLQFQRLIVDPFSLLASRPQHATRHPYLVVIDGLDECSDELAQDELICLINKASQRKDLPLLWLICSRPEPYLMYTFSRPDYSIRCYREELVIDDETRRDVERYLRDSFEKILTSSRYVITVPQDGCWPPQDDFRVISRASSGLFIFAETVIRVVNDPEVRNPTIQLKLLLGMLKGLNHVGARNPLRALDIFYTRILSKVSDLYLPVVTDFLGFRIYSDRHTVRGVEVLCGAEGILHGAMEDLHSVVRVPPLEDAAKKFISFYHKSFGDYLKDHRRSGRFHPSKGRFITTVVAKGLPIYNHFLACRNPDRVLPEELALSQSITQQWPFDGNEMAVGFRTLWHLSNAKQKDVLTADDTASCFTAIRDLNFSLTETNGTLYFFSLQNAIYQDWNTNIEQDFLRTHVVDEPTDTKLLHHLSILTNGKPIKPIDITRAEPLGGLGRCTMGYAIVGWGSKACIACIYRGYATSETWEIYLGTQSPPTTDQISEFRTWEEVTESYEARQEDTTQLGEKGGESDYSEDTGVDGEYEEGIGLGGGYEDIESNITGFRAGPVPWGTSYS
ncbi:hypothetical protein P691DRAFT_779197 [Macrolepiota fuliginosa MF-IS2]|uniref:Nephrocystin 3-like N-terminal domain-containing protein n=1 Tax=Macrolepiota fuliginosa MF-IS2 TaxID=1400762 RepID=A0A9P5X1E2_9AGAR|nr:hypothetical protein P691DRAFT_779197 [Macrolepiota fuliginosa MF-IS2]